MSDQTRPAAPEGWYPDPEDSRYQRWWNGHRWELRRPVPDPRTPSPIGRGFHRWSQVLGVLLVFNLLVACGEVALYSWGLGSAIGAVEAGDVDTANSFDALNLALSLGGAVTLLVGGVVWMVWQFQLARATTGLRRTPAMHAFSWIIPIGNLWLPLQNVRDLWQRILPLRGTPVLGWWWACWIGSAVISRLLRTDAEIDSVTDLRAMIWTALVVALLALVGTVLALHIVRSLNRASATAEAVSRAVPPGA